MPANIGELAASTLENYRKEMSDNILNHNPLSERLQRKGNIRTVEGGRVIEEHLIYAENSTAKWFSGLELLDVSYNETIDVARFDPKQLNANVIISGLEEMKNAGEEAKFNLIEARIKVAEKTLQNSLGVGVFAAGTGSGGKEIGGLQYLVADSPSTGTVGGIDRASYTFWRNQVSASAATSSGNIISRMNTTWLTTVRGNDSPDMIVADSVMYGHYENALQAYQRFAGSNSANKASGAFESLKYKTADVFYDENCPTKHLYMLNTDYLFLKVYAGKNFAREEMRKPINQDAYMIPIFWGGNMTCSNCALQAVVIAS